MQDLCLSFTDEAQSLPILYTIVPDSSEMIPNYQNISVIGVVYERPPIPPPPDYVPVPFPTPNWGVNIRLLDDEDITPLQLYIVDVVDPIRVWA